MFFYHFELQESKCLKVLYLQNLFLLIHLFSIQDKNILQNNVQLKSNTIELVVVLTKNTVTIHVVENYGFGNILFVGKTSVPLTSYENWLRNPRV